MADNNQYSWNKTLKFSWGHIIAFVAIIFLSYVMYMGAFYSNGGDFMQAAIVVAVLDFFLLLTFIGAQVLKGSDTHFQRSLVIERILIVLCPFAFVAAMVSYNHFWNVLSERDQIEDRFNASISSAKEMFVDYETYSNTRLSHYDGVLDSLISNGRITELSKANYLKALELQLLSENTDNLKDLAIEWVDDANSGASVWNAFLIGNIDQITSAIKGWQVALTDFSTPVLSNETLYGNKVETFEMSGGSFDESMHELQELSKIYVTTKGINVNAIWTGVILCLMLIFPYLLQTRNTRAQGFYSLIPQFSSKRTNSGSKKKDESSDDKNSGNGLFDGTF